MDTYEGDLEFNREESTIGPLSPILVLRSLFIKPIKCESIFLTAFKFKACFPFFF